MTKLYAGYTAFNKPSLVDDPYQFDADFDDYDNRRLRYNLHWNYYGNEAYIDTVKYTKAYKTQFGLYRYIEAIYNPAYRLGQFWQGHIWGGPPLEFGTENDKLKEALAQIYLWSNWPIKKDIVTLYGAVMGDVGIRIRDDDEAGKVYFEAVHPASIAYKEEDAQGNVKGYILQEEREDPNDRDKAVIYTEEVTRNGDDVIYKTFLNHKPYAWNGSEAEYSVAYGFVPMVFIKNIDVGGLWGWSEYQGALSKFRKIDDTASMMFDQIRKMVDPYWLFSGLSSPTITPGASKTQPPQATVGENPYPGREEMNALYAKDPQAKAQALVADLDLSAVGEEIQRLQTEIERDKPELRLDVLNAGGDISGRALRIIRQPVSGKIETRRVNYDDALIRANMMALSIAGMRKYAGFEAFGLDSFEKGDLTHTIIERPVFTLDPMDVAEIDEKEATALKIKREAMSWSTTTTQREALKNDAFSEKEVEEMLTQWRTDALLEDDFGMIPDEPADAGQPATDGGDADTPSNIEAAAGLNGAQIRAALDVLQGVIDGTTPVEVAEELLIAVGIEESRARRMAQLTAQKGKLSGFTEKESPPGAAPPVVPNGG